MTMTDKRFELSLDIKADMTPLLKTQKRLSELFQTVARMIGYAHSRLGVEFEEELKANVFFTIIFKVIYIL